MPSGETQLTSNRAFRWTATEGHEIYGWFETAHETEKGTNGWWRTTDPKIAEQRALELYPTKLRPSCRCSEAQLANVGCDCEADPFYWNADGTPSIDDNDEGMRRAKRQFHGWL